MKNMQQMTVAVVGLGYVGLPLAVAFGRIYNTIGVDANAHKIECYGRAFDPTGEVSEAGFRAADKVQFTADVAQISVADIVVVAVPTPIDNARQPDLSPLKNVTRAIAPHLKLGAVVVFESTVYPGVTDDICGALIEAESDLVRGRDFKLGYSPERINPGDKEHTLQKIVKVVSGEDAETLELVAELYASVVDAGVYQASSIRVAEAAKVIENIQRDLNIALMNELAIIFDKLGLDTEEVLRAAGTKWNFLPFRPGLVGGHCIGVDPYYLTYRAQIAGLHPEVILAGRKTNDGMGKYVAEQAVKLMIREDKKIKGSRVLVLGITFKENCGDFRNTRVVDIIASLAEYGVEPVITDPRAEAQEVKREYGYDLIDFDSVGSVDAVIAAVPHNEFTALPVARFESLKNGASIPFLDVKSAFDQHALEQAGFKVWRL